MPIELAGRFDVDRQQAQRHGAIDLAGALADSGEHDLSGRKPQRSATSTSPMRVRIGVAAERAHQPHDRQRRVRLERVVNRVRIAVERGVQRAVGGADGVGVVDVGRGADRGGDLVRAARRRRR